MAIPVADIIDQVKVTLMDVDGARWPTGELVEWLNKAVREIIRLVPDAGVLTIDHALVAGVRQTLPTGGLRLVDVVKNATGGAAIRQMDRDVLDVYRPAWRTETNAVVQGYLYDSRDPKSFEVFPGRAGAASVTIVYQAIPDEADVGENLPLDDIYQGAVIDYMLFRAHSKDSEDSSPDMQRAQAYYQGFLATLGVKQEIDAQAEPKGK